MIQTTDRIYGALSLAPMTVKEIAKRLCMNPNTIASAVRKMAAENVIYCWNMIRGVAGRPQRVFGLRWKP